MRFRFEMVRGIRAVSHDWSCASISFLLMGSYHSNCYFIPLKSVLPSIHGRLET